MDLIFENGISVIGSSYSVDQTVERLLELLRTRKVMLFAIIDHSGEAAKIGLTMRPTQLVIFGNPAAGTPLMLARPTAALDLPLKILVSEDVEGRVWLSYNSPEYLERRHGLTSEMGQNIAVVKGLAMLAGE